MITYLFDDFPYVDKPIYIPINTVFYRGISRAKTIQNLNPLRKDTPIYIAPKYIAESYSSGNTDILYRVYLKKELRLIDIRKVINLLPMILNKSNTNEYNIRMSNIIKLNLGVSTIDDQISIINQIKEIPKDRIDKLIEFSKKFRLFRTGVRIPITNFDSEIFILLKFIFSSYYDGIIAPQLPSPFEYNNMSHEEIIIFNADNLELLPNENNVLIEQRNIMSIITGSQEPHNFDLFPIVVGGKYKKSDFINRNKYFDNEKWLAKIQKKINKNFPNISIKDDLWNNSYHIIHRHLELSSFNF